MATGLPATFLLMGMNFLKGLQVLGSVVSFTNPISIIYELFSWAVIMAIMCS